MADQMLAADASAAPVTSWELQRRAKRAEDALLLTDTLELLRHLPRGVQPRRLARQFPRVANEVRRLWYETDALNAYLDTLLVDSRGTREGFPALVAEEIRALRAYVGQRNRAEEPTPA